MCTRCPQLAQTDDRFWVIVFATGPTEVHLSTGLDEAKKQVWTVEGGLSKLSHPIVAGGSMKATMVRDGVIVVECAPERDGFRVERNPKTYNFNAFVAASS